MLADLDLLGYALEQHEVVLRGACDGCRPAA